MALQIVSDLHLEKPPTYDVFEIIPEAPYLALLGDIGLVRDDGFFTFIKAQLQKFQIVFLLLGNHEPWHSTWVKTKERIKQFSDSVKQQYSTKDLGVFVFLDQTRYDLSSEVTILGCTLYSQISEQHRERISTGVNDFYHIDNWTVDDHNAAHRADLDWLNGQVSEIATSEPQRKIVVFTHYSPVAQDPRAVDPRHVDSPLSSGFATDLSMQECWKNSRVCLWAFGHTHYNTEFMEEGTGKLVVSNQRGYYSSHSKGFEPRKVVRG
ncbi:hypothetical protein N7448_007562 [Penicillium atrosanguineum]|nr:hypothetical protein N7448_007562 [Penicillium atrosanguineum]KAJ5146989.1 hypothetical protein N7526_000341 [Penicillium atrosanguineum]